jgi:hypothetical protein
MPRWVTTPPWSSSSPATSPAAHPRCGCSRSAGSNGSTGGCTSRASFRSSQRPARAITLGHMASRASAPIGFKATLRRPARPANAAWAFLVLPKSASAKLPARSQVTVEGVFAAAPLQPRGARRARLRRWRLASGLPERPPPLPRADLVMLPEVRSDTGVWNPTRSEIFSTGSEVVSSSSRARRSRGFTDVRVIDDSVVFQGVRLTRTGGQHGTDEMYAVAAGGRQQEQQQCQQGRSRDDGRVPGVGQQGDARGREMPAITRPPRAARVNSRRRLAAGASSRPDLSEIVAGLKR